MGEQGEPAAFVLSTGEVAGFVCRARRAGLGEPWRERRILIVWETGGVGSSEKLKPGGHPESC